MMAGKCEWLGGSGGMTVCGAGDWSKECGKGSAAFVRTCRAPKMRSQSEIYFSGAAATLIMELLHHPHTRRSNRPNLVTEGFESPRRANAEGGLWANESLRGGLAQPENARASCSGQNYHTPRSPPRTKGTLPLYENDEVTVREDVVCVHTADRDLHADTYSTLR
jgi:hypothetical protein